MARRPTEPRPAAAKKAVRKRAAPSPGKPATARKPTAKKTARRALADPDRTPAERERRFNLLLQTACLKAGTASAVGTITRKVPLLSKLAPKLFGDDSEAFSLGRLQHELVRDVIALYDLELSELEERGVILLASAVTENAQALPRQLAERIVTQLGGRYLQPVARASCRWRAWSPTSPAPSAAPMPSASARRRCATCRAAATSATCCAGCRASTNANSSPGAAKRSSTPCCRCAASWRCARR